MEKYRIGCVLVYPRLIRSFESAFERVVAARPFIEPNDGFVLQLKAFEVELKL